MKLSSNISSDRELRKEFVDKVALKWRKEVVDPYRARFKKADDAEIRSARRGNAEIAQQRKFVETIFSLIEQSGARIIVGEIECTNPMVRALAVAKDHGKSLQEQIEAVLFLV